MRNCLQGLLDSVQYEQCSVRQCMKLKVTANALKVKSDKSCTVAKIFNMFLFPGHKSFCEYFSQARSGDEGTSDK